MKSKTSRRPLWHRKPHFDRQSCFRAPSPGHILGLVLISCSYASAADWPEFGRDGTRNAVSPEKGPPKTWSVGQRDEKTRERIAGTSKNVRWAARLGSLTAGDPVVANGLVWVGTNNAGKPDASVLACFRESDGKLLYRYVSPRLPKRENDWPNASLACSPLVEGDRIWFMTNRAEVVCLDIGPLKRNEGLPQPVWKIDLIAQYGVFPCGSRMNVMRLCSIAGYCDLIYVVTGNGANYLNNLIPNPNAPSLLCLRKEDGEKVWEDKSPGENILDGQWSSPTVVEVGTCVQCIVAQGDGWVRSFDAFSGEPIWQFDMNRKESRWNFVRRSSRNGIPASPVFADNRVYIASGQFAYRGGGQGRLACIDPTRRGDISSELAVDAAGKVIPHRRIQAVDPASGEKAIANPNSGLLWEFEKAPDGKTFDDEMHCMVANVAVHKGLVIACDYPGLVHCFDAKSGRRYWAYDVMGAIFGSPLIVDDKVYITDDQGGVSIFSLSSDPDVAMRGRNGLYEPLRLIEMDEGILCSPVFANGVLYLATDRELFAVAADQDKPQANVAGGYWPQWRGPNRDNVSSESGLLREWPADGPPRQWTASGLGEGIASVAVADGLIYTVGYQDDSEFVVTVHEATGELAWATRIGPAVAENPMMRWLIQRTPTVDGERLYALTAGGDLICLNSLSGKESWRKSYTADFGAQRPIFGFGDFPLVDEDQLICTVGEPKPQVISLDKKTGAVVWATVVPGGNAGVEDYGATAVVDLGGTSASGGLRQYITAVQNQLTGIAAEGGRILWTYAKPENAVMSGHTPVIRGNRVFVSYRDNTAVLLKLDREGDRVMAEQEFRWNFISDRFQDSNVLVGEYLFHEHRPSALGCNRWPNGEEVWAKRTNRVRFSFTYADGRLFLLTSAGKATLVEATPEGYKPKGEFAVPDYQPAQGATAPVIADGRLYLRSNDRLHCYDVRTDRPAEQAPARSVTLPKLRANDSDNASARAPRQPRVPNGVYVPTPHDVVKRMLELAEVAAMDVVYDLGCGDGRIVIAAAKDYGCRALGYDIDAELVAIAREQAKTQGVEKLVTIERGDLFDVDLAKANVVTLYLLPQQNEKLVSQLRKMQTGSRIVAHEFALPGVTPEKTVTVESNDSGERHTIYLYKLPLKISQQRD